MLLVNKNEKGIGLVEVIAALGLAVIILTTLVALSLFTLRSQVKSNLLLEGTKMANREIELVRAYRDTSLSWEDFISSLTSNNCYVACHVNFSGNMSIVSGPETINSGAANQISRQFRATKTDGTLLDLSSNVVRISVDVSWVVGEKTESTSVYTDLTSWTFIN